MGMVMRYQAIRNALMGEQGSTGLDRAVFHALLCRLVVVWARDGVYRLGGTQEALDKFALWAESELPEGVNWGPELPPNPPALQIEVGPERESPRRMWLHTGEPDAPNLVARAIDAGLSVVESDSVGRFLITGPSQRQVHWVMFSQQATREQALQIMQATEEMLRAEDNGPPPITVALPDRETLSSITRDEHGQIASVVQVTRDVPPTAGEGTN